MPRALIVCDCDEVLLHMVRHFAQWLDQAHAIDFSLDGNPFAQSLSRRGDPAPLTSDAVWSLLGAFFDTQMDRQLPIAGAVEAVTQMQDAADFVILTNLQDERRQARRAQLAAVGIHAPVYTNQGPKGPALKTIVEEFQPSRLVFIDDIAGHHASARQVVLQSRRLQFCGEKQVAPHIPCALAAGDAHARIDRWDEALPWVLRQINEEDGNAN